MNIVFRPINVNFDTKDYVINIFTSGIIRVSPELNFDELVASLVAGDNVSFDIDTDEKTITVNSEAGFDFSQLADSLIAGSNISLDIDLDLQTITINGSGGGEDNVIEEVQVDSVPLTVTDKTVNIDLSGKMDKDPTAVDADTLTDASVFQFWKSTIKKITWANIKSTLKTYFDTLYQALLVSGTNIKTINGSDILGSGDLVISGGDVNVIEEVKRNGVPLTVTGKSVDIAVPINSDFTLSGLSEKSYNSLTDKPIIPTPITVHNDLTNRDAADSHTISAISGLDSALKKGNIAVVKPFLAADSPETLQFVSPDSALAWILANGEPDLTNSWVIELPAGLVMEATADRFVHVRLQQGTVLLSAKSLCQFEDVIDLFTATFQGYGAIFSVDLDGTDTAGFYNLVIFDNCENCEGVAKFDNCTVLGGDYELVDHEFFKCSIGGDCVGIRNAQFCEIDGEYADDANIINSLIGIGATNILKGKYSNCTITSANLFELTEDVELINITNATGFFTITVPSGVTITTENISPTITITVLAGGTWVNRDLFQLPNRSYTTIERDALTSVLVGQKIYNSTNERNEMWNGTLWIEIDEGELRWRDEYVGGAWIPAAGAAAPDLNNYTIGGVATRMYEFDGNVTEERLSNTFEIPHDIPIDLVNDGTTYIECHIHWMPSTNDVGVVEWFFDWCYIPANAAPIAMSTMSVLCDVAINQQYVHKLKAFEFNDIAKVPIPAGGFGIGGIILFNLRRTPAGQNDTYPEDALLIKVALHVPTDDRGSRDIYDN